MEKIEINLLKSEIYAQIKEIEKLFIDIEDRKKGQEGARQNLRALLINSITFTVLLKIYSRQLQGILKTRWKILPGTNGNFLRERLFQLMV